MSGNVSGVERAVSVAAGAALLWLGFRQRPTNRAVQLDRRRPHRARADRILPGERGARPRPGRSDTKVALGGDRGMHVHESIVINRPAAELFRFWRDLRNLPRFMEHLDDVRRAATRRRSVWTARAPIGMRVKWEAESSMRSTES